MFKNGFIDLKKELFGPTPCMLWNLPSTPGGSSEDDIVKIIRSSAKTKKERERERKYWEYNNLDRNAIEFKSLLRLRYTFEISPFLFNSFFLFLITVYITVPMACKFKKKESEVK